jgi:hypothetical protein
VKLRKKKQDKGCNVLTEIVDYCIREYKINPDCQIFMMVGMYMRCSGMNIEEPEFDVAKRVLLNFNESETYILQPSIKGFPRRTFDVLEWKNVSVDLGNSQVNRYSIKVPSNPVSNYRNSNMYGITQKSANKIRRARYQRITIILDFKDPLLNNLNPQMYSSSSIKKLIEMKDSIRNDLTEEQKKQLDCIFSLDSQGQTRPTSKMMESLLENKDSKNNNNKSAVEKLRNKKKKKLEKEEINSTQLETGTEVLDPPGSAIEYLRLKRQNEQQS